MFIECWGHQSALYLWSFVMFFVYRCKREYYLSEFKVLFIIYGELTVSETKCITNNLIRQWSRCDCSHSLYQSQQNVVKLTTTSFPISFTHSVSFLVSCRVLNSFWTFIYLIVFPEVLPSKSIVFSKINSIENISSIWGVKSDFHVTYKLYPQLLWLMSITQYPCLHNFICICICLFSCSAFFF